VQKSALLAAIQKEIQRHDLSYFVDEPPSVAQGGRGVVVAGCPAMTPTESASSRTARGRDKSIIRLPENDKNPGGCGPGKSSSRLGRNSSCPQLVDNTGPTDDTRWQSIASYDG
jgi:hypothetical protein